jgi:hypothetical protein
MLEYQNAMKASEAAAAAVNLLGASLSVSGSNPVGADSGGGNLAQFESGASSYLAGVDVLAAGDESDPYGRLQAAMQLIEAHRSPNPSMSQARSLSISSIPLDKLGSDLKQVAKSAVSPDTSARTKKRRMVKETETGASASSSPSCSGCGGDRDDEVGSSEWDWAMEEEDTAESARAERLVSCAISREGGSSVGVGPVCGAAALAASAHQRCDRVERRVRRRIWGTAAAADAVSLRAHPGRRRRRVIFRKLLRMT